MKHLYSNLKKFLIAAVCFLPMLAGAQLNVNSGGSAQDLANAILGSGVSVSNVTLNCSDNAYGIFSNGGSTNVGLNNGILLTTGNASDAIGPNNDGGITQNNGNAFNGDSDLDNLVSGSIEDACRLEFDFVAESDFISVQYVFGSEEYNEYVCSQFNDVFGFFVTGAIPAGGNYNGQNVALVPSTALPVSVNTINIGVPGSNGSFGNCVSLDYTEYYVNNASGVSIQYDGFTVVLTAQIAVVPGETYHFKFAIADVSDSNLDSGVFIKSQSFSVFNCQAGTINWANGEQEFCSNDEIADMLSVVSNSTAVGDDYAFLLTDIDGNILAISNDGNFDLGSYANGNYLVYGISYDGIVSGIEVGENLSDITVAEDEGCFDLSLPFPVRIETCINFELIACAPDVTVECGTDLNDYTITGMPQVATNSTDGEITFVPVDVVISSSDCGSVISRTWIITYGETSISCIQTITIVDTTGPVISGYESPVYVQCLEDVPAFDDVTAMDVCSGEAEVETFESQTGEVETECVLSTAFGPGADWAVWLPVLSSGGVTSSANFVFDVNGGQFDQFIDGTAHLYGTVVNTLNSNEQFIVDLWFDNKADWATWSGLGRNYKNDLGLACATADHNNWSYYELVGGFSTFTGAGDLAGDVLYVYHMPADYYFGFQVGTGANNKNCNYGLSGWFTYDGFVDGESIEGHGDVNVDADCETGGDSDCIHNTSFTHFYRAEDACGHATIAAQSIIVNDTTAPEFSNCPESITIECSDEVPAVATGILAVDNCTGDVTVAYLGETSEGNACSTVLTRVWSATDICGNRSECTQTITIIDSTSPELVGLPAAEITVECDAVPAAAEVSAVDNCQEVVVVDYSEEISEGNCPGNYTIYRYWYAADSCQNYVDFSQTIHVEDTTAPVFDAYDFYAHIECDEVPALITATDNCGTATVVVIEEVLNSGGCLGVYYRVYQATDECGNVTTAEQYIAIQDNTAPEIVGVPADTEMECNEVSMGEDGHYFGNDGVYGVDNCEMEVNIEYSEEVVETDDNCPQSYDIIRTWVATDYCDNQSTETQTVHVVDTTAPVLYIPYNYEAACDAELVYDEASAYDNCGDVTISEIVDTIAGNCPNNYTITRTFSATDECGNASEPQTQYITVVDYYAPVFEEAQSEYNYECDEEVELIQPVAYDNCSDVIEYSHVDGEMWGNSCYYGFTRVWTAEDECGLTSTFNQYITIEDTTAPVISGESQLDRPCDDYLGIFVTATDNCNDFDFDYYDEHVSGSCAGNVVRHYTATDICGNISAEFVQIIHLTDNVDPIITYVAPNFEVECGDEYGVESPSFSDNCDEELDIVPGFTSSTDGCSTTEVYTWTATDHCGNFVVATTIVTIVDTTNPWFENFPANETVSCEQELPAVVYPSAYDACDQDVEVELSLDSAAGSCPQELYIYRVFRGFDNCGNQVVETQTIHIIDETAPMFSYDQQYVFTYECDEVVPVINPAVSDNCGMVTLSHEDIEAWGNSCYNGYTRVWTATDECDNSSMFYQYIYIQDTTAPVVNPYDVEIEMPCDNISNEILISAVDNCNEVTITFVDEPVSGACAGRLMRTYTIYDECGNYTEGLYQQFITLIDETAPVGNEPADIVVACDEAVPAFDPNFTDNCSEELILSHSMPLAAGYCNVSVTESWTAIDACGNTTTVDRVITFVDNVNPWFTYVPEVATYECTEEINYGMAEATDNCDLNVDVTVTVDTVAGNCPSSYEIVRTFTATDECNNTAIAYQSIYVQDTTSPWFSDNNQSQFNYECGTTAPVVEPVAFDACSTFELSYLDGNEWSDGCYYGFNRVWTAIDACGNDNQFVQYISFNDTTAPVVAPFDFELDMPCDDISDAILISATDNCNDVIITFSDEHVSGGCAGKIIRTYTVRDECYNYTEGLIQQIITLVDETAPVITNAPESITVECGNGYASYVPVWSDNCSEEIITSAISGISFVGCNQVISEVYFAEDLCGNVDSVSRTITIIDTTDPFFTNLPADEDRDCSASDVVAPATAEDACDDDVTITHTDVIVEGDCPANYTIERTYRAVDNCGNEAVHTQYIYVSDETAPMFNEGQSNYTYECGSDAELIQPVATDNCSTISYNHTDGDVWVDGCLSGFVRTWTATDACGNESYPFYQYISFEDTTDPILDGCPTDIVLACDAEIPAPAQVSASDLCDDNVDLDYEEYIMGDMPAEGSIADCDLLTPVRPANNPCVYPYDWAMALFAMPSAHRWYYVSEGNLVQYPDGSVHVTATMNNVLNPSNGWLVDVWFQGGFDWAAWSSQSFPTSFKADCGGEDDNHTQWMYFLLQAGQGAELTGFGGYAGSTLNLVHAPANNYFGFQLGDGANNYNGADNGFGGWFSYSGTFRTSSTADFSNVSGAGDFAFELDCCPDYWIVRQWTATDCSGNSVTCSQNITFEGTNIEVVLPGIVEEAKEETSKVTSNVSVAPNPATDNTMFKFTAINAEKTTLEIFDMTGSKVADVFMGVVEAGVEYQVNYNVNNLATGVYMFRLTNGSDVQIDRLIINK